MAPRITCLLTGVICVSVATSMWNIHRLFYQPPVKVSALCTRRHSDADYRHFPKNNRLTNHRNRQSEISETNDHAPKPVVDMVNGYHPFVNFSLSFPKVMPRIPSEEANSCFLVVTVLSAARGEECRHRRAMTRKTWGSYSTCEQQKMMRNKTLSKLKWLLVFVLAKVGPRTDDDKRNEEEAKLHNDMLIGNFPDSYHNLIVKCYMARFWTAITLQNVEYILKIDDDVYARIPKVVEYLADAGFPKPFYGGHVLHRHTVDRRPNGRWAVSWKYYPKPTFPKMNAGPLYLLSKDLFPHLFNYVHVRKPFHTEDAYVAVALRDANVEATDITSFDSRTVPNMTRHITQRSDCHTVRLIGFGHQVQAIACEILHHKLESMCTKNMTASAICPSS